MHLVIEILYLNIILSSILVAAYNFMYYGRVNSAFYLTPTKFFYLSSSMTIFLSWFQKKNVINSFIQLNRLVGYPNKWILSKVNIYFVIWLNHTSNIN